MVAAEQIEYLQQGLVRQAVAVAAVAHEQFEQAIQRGFADSARTIRLPVHVLEMLSKLSRIEREMHQRLGREPTPEELAVELDKSPAQVQKLVTDARRANVNTLVVQVRRRGDVYYLGGPEPRASD